MDRVLSRFSIMAMTATLLILATRAAVPAPVGGGRGAPAAPDPDRNGGWITYHWAGGLSPYSYLDLALSVSGRLEFSTEFRKGQPVKVVYELTPAELTYMRSLVGPIAELDGKDVSHMATDLGNSSLRVGRPDGAVVRLDWVLTDQPDLIVWHQFVWKGLAEKERYRQVLSLSNPRLPSDLSGLSFDLQDMFRPQELRDQLWGIIEEKPLAGYNPLHDRGPLGDALSVLALWDSPEEWAGRTLAIVEKLSPDDKLRAASSLSSYVANHAKDRPWDRLTPFFLQVLRYARSLPESEPGKDYWWDAPRAQVEWTVRILADPAAFGDTRAKAALATK